MVYVTMLSLQTEYKNPPASRQPVWSPWCSKDLNAKLTKFKSAVGAFHNHVVQLNQGQAPDLHLFTAPEFSFACHEALQQKVDNYTISDFAYASTDMDLIKRAVAEVAADTRYKNLVVAPGTVFWKRQAVLPQMTATQVVVEGKTYNFQPGINELAIDGTTYYRYDNFNTAQALPKQPDVNARDSTSKAVQNDVHKTVSDHLLRVRKELDEQRLAVQNLVAVRNTAFIGHGKHVATYDKMYPDEAEYDEVFTIFTPGKQVYSGAPNGIRMAVEVCADHASGALELHLGREIDLQLIMSAYVSLSEEGTQVREDGVVVLADTRRPGVYRWAKGNFDAIEPVAVLKLGDLSAQLFSFQL